MAGDQTATANSTINNSKSGVSNLNTKGSTKPGDKPSQPQVVDKIAADEALLGISRRVAQMC